MKQAPQFSLKNQHDQLENLSNYVGKWVVVYFYPKDDTPGCTKEACSFKDARQYLEEKGVKVFGISKDSVKSHAKFAEKHGLTFSLLSDPEAEVIKAYGAWGPKKFMGREFLGIHRYTYLINPEGYIVKEYLKVTPDQHALDILNDIKELED
jgi:thioredoxin-dependent peroxiredoxin